MSDTETLGEDPRPLLELASAPEAVYDALELLAADAPAPLARARHDALFHAAVDRSRGRRASTSTLAFAFAAACLLGAVVSAGLIDAARGPEYVAADGAVASLEGRLLTITRGHVELRPRRALTVRAGSLTLTLHAGRVAMDVTSEGVAVHVEQGEAVVRDGDTQHRLTAGQTLSTLPAPPTELALPEARTESCAAGADACLTALSEGDGLEAETALYELGLTAHERGDTRRANALFAEHRRRFPDGVLAPEASIGLMLGHTALRDAAAASAEARRFLERFPSDPRVVSVRALVR